MSRARKNYLANFKAKVALSALREDEPISELSSRFGIHTTVIHRWKREALQGIDEAFKGKPERDRAYNQDVIKNFMLRLGS